ncbi:MAG: carbon storage regulator [Zetaproteobacteria bacterium]|nr:carbon storage regulator [Zetaproteobacteria bacterium]
MLILKRKVGEAIYIGDDIRLVLTGVDKLRGAHIGIDAPISVAVHRKEIYDLIKQENLAANKGSSLEWLQAFSDASDEGSSSGSFFQSLLSKGKQDV